MAQYNTLNAKLSNSQLNKLNSGIRNCTEVTLSLSLNMIADSNEEYLADTVLPLGVTPVVSATNEGIQKKN